VQSSVPRVKLALSGKEESIFIIAGLDLKIKSFFNAIKQKEE